MIAIPVGFSSVIVVWWHWIIALLLIPTAFALAWLGHLIEGNKPAFLTNPAHVFVAPVWMGGRSSEWVRRRPRSNCSWAVGRQCSYFCLLSPSQPVGMRISLIAACRA
jgi:hypothetical protein